jgi:hypothetical protein
MANTVSGSSYCTLVEDQNRASGSSKDCQIFRCLLVLLQKSDGGSCLPPLAWFGGFMDTMRRIRFKVTRKDTEMRKGN